jgi:hypothetical protein
MSTKNLPKNAALGTLARFTSEQLKNEIQRRRDLERARKHLPRAEAALARAEERVKRYRALIEEYGMDENGKT